MTKPKPTEEPKDAQVVNPFSPKTQFQKYQAESARQLQEVTNSKWFRVSLDAALAQAGYAGATEEQMNGIKKFINTLLMLPEKDLERKELPAQRLETFDE